MNIEQTVSAAVAGLQLGNTFTFDNLRHTSKTGGTGGSASSNSQTSTPTTASARP